MCGEIAFFKINMFSWLHTLTLDFHKTHISTSLFETTIFSSNMIWRSTNFFFVSGNYFIHMMKFTWMVEKCFSSLSKTSTKQRTQVFLGHERTIVARKKGMWPKTKMIQGINSNQNSSKKGNLD